MSKNIGMTCRSGYLSTNHKRPQNISNSDASTAGPAELRAINSLVQSLQAKPIKMMVCT